MYFDRGDELVEQIFSPNPFEYGDELAKRIFQPNPKEPSMYSRRRVRRLRRRNPYRYNPDRGNCPHCDAGLRAKHYAKNQCWRCKRQLTRGRSRSLFGRAPAAALGIAARRGHRRLRRYNPTDTSFFEHDAGVFGGPSWGRRRLRRYNPLWDKVKTAGKTAGSVAARAGRATARGVGKAARATKRWYDEGGRDKIIATGRAAGRGMGRAASVAGRGLQRAGELATEKLSDPAPTAGRYLRRYRYNPSCEDCGCDMCTCNNSRYRRNPCIDCGCDPCTCIARRNPCARCGIEGCSCGCEGDPALCTCGSRRYRLNPQCKKCSNELDEVDITLGSDVCEACATLGQLEKFEALSPDEEWGGENFGWLCPNCNNRPCVCDSHRRYRYNPCEDCDGDPCTCGSHSAYHPNPGTTRHWDPIEARTARWEPGQMWAEAEPEEDDDLDRSYRYYRRNG